MRTKRGKFYMVKYYKAENELLNDWIKQVSYDLRTAEDYLDNNRIMPRETFVIIVSRLSKSLLSLI